MVTSEYIDVDDEGKMINCSPLSYKIPNVRSIPRKFNVTLVQEDTADTPVYSAKVGHTFYFRFLSSLGPVVQSIVSLTSSLRGQLVKCFTTL